MIYLADDLEVSPAQEGEARKKKKKEKKKRRRRKIMYNVTIQPSAATLPPILERWRIAAVPSHSGRARSLACRRCQEEYKSCCSHSEAQMGSSGLR